MTTFGLAGRRSPFNALSAFLAGVLTSLAEALLHPTIVLVFFVSQLTDSLRIAGLISTVGLLGWYLPQLLVPWLANSSTRQLPWAAGASLIRAVAAIFLAYSGYRTDITGDERLRSFFVCYVVYSVASGFAQVPVNSLTARGLNGDGRARVFRQRTLWGGVAGIGAGLLARQTLGPSGPGFPRDVTLLFIVAAASVAGATVFIARIREPRSLLPDRQTIAAPRVKDFGRVLADGAFRGFAFFGLTGAVATLADPFYVIYARREFDLPASMIGVCLALFAGGTLLSAPLWAAITRVAGARSAIQTAAALRVIAPLIIIALPYVIDTDLYRDHVANERVVFYVLAAPFAVFGIAARGFAAGNFQYIKDIAVPERRTAYQMLALTPLLVAAFAPLAAAEIAGRWDLDTLFLVALLAGFASILSAGLLTDTGRGVRSPSAAWRLHDTQSRSGIT